MSGTSITIGPAPFVTFPVVVWLVDGAAAGRYGGLISAATAGWWFGFGYFLSGLYWIGNAFLVEADAFGWLLRLHGPIESGAAFRAQLATERFIAEQSPNRCSHFGG